jgi:hypothetical protein
MNDWKLLVILAAIGLSWFFLRKYIGANAENLAQKEDLRALIDIVEGVRAQFERANLVHRVQFEAEFRACQDVWREANNTHREFIRLYPIAFGKPTPFQRGEFINAQQAFADALEAGKPFMNQTVWKAFFEFENSIIVWKDVEMIPKESINESREEARLGLERCAEEIRKRFSELLVS